jgi:Holliday junction resolvasome RuvABC endonuclease subunit
MGIDAASYKTGYFILDINNLKYKIGTIEAKGNDLYERLRQINQKTKAIVNIYNPDIVIIESTYLDEWRKHKNAGKKRGGVNTLKILEKVHGAIIAATPELTDIFYLNPSEHKEALTGMGNAQKQSTIWAIQKKLGIGTITDDEADAAALVLTYLIKRKQWDILELIKNKFETQN